MSKRFGKQRVAGCKCTYNFTCKACLLAAPPPIFTPNGITPMLLAQAEQEVQ